MHAADLRGGRRGSPSRPRRRSRWASASVSLGRELHVQAQLGAPAVERPRCARCAPRARGAPRAPRPSRARAGRLLSRCSMWIVTSLRGQRLADRALDVVGDRVALPDRGVRGDAEDRVDEARPPASRTRTRRISARGSASAIAARAISAASDGRAVHEHLHVLRASAATAATITSAGDERARRPASARRVARRARARGRRATASVPAKSDAKCTAFAASAALRVARARRASEIDRAADVHDEHDRRARRTPTRRRRRRCALLPRQAADRLEDDHAADDERNAPSPSAARCSALPWP